MAIFSVLILTATPPGQSGEGGGAYMKVDGRESLLRAVEMFLNRDTIKQIQFVVSRDVAADVKSRYGANLAFSGVKLVAGGNRWIEQIVAGGKNIAPEATHVLIHDAARPAVPYSDIDLAMEAAEKSSAVVLAAPLRASLVELDDGGQPVATHSPQRFMQLQTPQIYTKAVFDEIVRDQREIHPSRLTVLKGSPLNVRLGAAGEAAFTRAMIAMLPKPKTRAASSPFDEAQW